MDIFSIIGIVLGFGSILGGQVLEGGSIMAIVQPTAFIIVMGGTIGATVLSFTPAELKDGLGTLSLIFQAFHTVGVGF
jgi:chemotaxis protein MotA